jgi:plasmid stabilization system protein ParE
MGHFRSDLAKQSLRFWHVRSYLIIHRREKDPIEIVRVLHGARDAQVILDGPQIPGG